MVSGILMGLSRKEGLRLPWTAVHSHEGTPTFTHARPCNRGRPRAGKNEIDLAICSSFGILLCLNAGSRCGRLCFGGGP